MNTLKLIKYVIVDKYGNPIYETLNNMKYLANCKSSFEVIKSIHNLKLIEKEKIN